MTLDGLPAHPLLVHAVVILLPLAAGALVLHAVWPAARRRLGLVTPGLALVVLALVPVTMRAGRDLADSIGAASSPQVQRHQQLADQLLPWTVALFVLAVAQWWWTGPGDRVLAGAGSAGGTGSAGGSSGGSAGGVRRLASLALLLLTLVVAVGATVVLVRAGDAGARATWGGVG